MLTQEERTQKIMRVTLLGSVGNLLLLIFKFVAGIVGHSGAMMADAVHSLSDFVTDVVVMVFVKISAKPKGINEYEGDDDGLSVDDIIGWTLLDRGEKTVGEITGYEDIPGNTCLYVETKDGQAMIPLHEDLILSVDEDSKSLSMAVPEGLI